MADINTSTYRKIAKTANIPVSVAKSIVQFRKREAKIQGLNELRNLPGVDKNIFEKICEKFKVIQRTAKSLPKDEKANKQTGGKITNNSYLAKFKSSKKLQRETETRKDDFGECSTCVACRKKKAVTPNLPVIAVTPEKRNTKQNKLKTYTPCSVRPSLSGGHIVAIYELVQEVQENKTNSNGTFNDNVHGSARWSTRVMPPDSSQYRHRKIPETQYCSIADIDKLSSIQKWLETVPPPKARTTSNKNVANILAEDQDLFVSLPKEHETQVLKHSQSRKTVEGIKVKRRISVSPHQHRTAAHHPNGSSDVLERTNTGTSGRIDTPEQTCTQRRDKTERSDNRCKQLEYRLPSAEGRSRSSYVQDRLERERRRHTAGDDRYRRKRHTKHIREYIDGPETDMDLRGAFCVLM